MALRVAGEREVFAFEVGFGSRCRLQVGPTRTTNRLETAGNVYPIVELLGFEQTVVSSVEIFSLDVDACECETLAGGLLNAVCGRRRFRAGARAI